MEGCYNVIVALKFEVISGGYKLQAVVQLAVAIAVHIGDLESAAQIAIVITLLERVLIAIEHQAPNIPLVVMQRLIGAAINSIVNVSTLVWLPIYGYFHGDHWLRQITSQVTLTFRGNETTEDGLVPFYWILVLPTQLISSLVQGLRTDISTLPMGQANPCMTLFTALAKARHWVRRTSHWHNVSYIGASYCGVATADDDGLWGLTDAEIENSFSINLGLTARQCSIAFLHDCYSGFASSGVHRHLVFPIALSAVEKVPPLSTIGATGEEEAIGHSIAPASSHIDPRPPQVRLTLPRDIEAIVTHHD
ncbi:hypothetical protein AK812_SmicGene43387 [Symbiodinium microadriaticum]|uniref:Uncharacterized protein n=1 Tax=Symbiodinium microadriaticum TaxID=2951 RepID=A0A1Q9C151_SYMMI|nr:hypothetical protein AK812_SmicGene43387 [Symbiodinium microadriaticum]